MLVDRLPVFIQSGDLEVQERVSKALHVMYVHYLQMCNVLWSVLCATVEWELPHLKCAACVCGDREGLVHVEYTV